jgi:Ca2+-binding RTX toxin-like protein
VVSATATRSVEVSAVALQPDPGDTSKTALVIGGTNEDDVIVVQRPKTGGLRVLINGAPQGTFAPTGRVIVHAGPGNDSVDVGVALPLPAWLFGEDGNDRLKGGASADVLDGGAGGDTLVGNGNRDLLIGGRGRDNLNGGTSDDILLGGTTPLSGNEAALVAVMAEWTSLRPYAVRVANLQGTGSGADFDARLNGDFFLTRQGPSATVLDDGQGDRLTGSRGRDWFFASLATEVKDILADKATTEIASA